MELDLNIEELQRLSGEILSLLRMTGVAADSARPAERLIEKESVSYLYTDFGKRFYEESHFPYRDGYDFPTFDVGGESEYSFLRGEDKRYFVSGDTANNALHFSMPGVHKADALQRRREMERTSEYFRKDSRRYDGKLEKY